MFPIPFNFPFRKSNGDISTIGAEISAGGGGSSYTLPTASANTKGGVKVGEGLTMDGEVLKNTNPTPATPYTLPTASAETLGGVKVGTGLAIDENGVLSASGGGGSSVERFVINVPSAYQTIPHGEMKGVQVQISNSSMVGKRIISANVSEYTSGTAFVVGVTRNRTGALELDEWVQILAYCNHATLDSSLTKVELYCV